MSLVTRETCGRCGVYRRLHPVDRCKGFRASWWWDRHLPVRHFAGVAWLTLPDSLRWRIVGAIYDRRPHLCWCEFVDAAYLDDKRDDYKGEWGCGCDVPLPIGVGLPRPGWCYCAPPTEERAA